MDKARGGHTCQEPHQTVQGKKSVATPCVPHLPDSYLLVVSPGPSSEIIFLIRYQKEIHQYHHCIGSGSALKWRPGSGSAIEMLISDPDPAAVKNF
jgi:hypothetical protein